MKSIVSNRFNRSARTILAVLCFLLLFVILLAMVSHFYVLPAMELSKHLDHAGRQKLAANAMLVLILLLTLLLVGLLLTFRISRFFFPRPTLPRSRTRVVDAWAEAGKRMDQETKDQEEE